MQACAALSDGNPMKQYIVKYKDLMNPLDASQHLLELASGCGLPASTVKRTLTQDSACSGTLVHPRMVLAPAECVAPVYKKMGNKINLVLGTVNNCSEMHTSSFVVFHPVSNAAMIILDTPSKHMPVQLYHTGTVFIKLCVCVCVCVCVLCV